MFRVSSDLPPLPYDAILSGSTFQIGLEGREVPD